jgi:hypothetical protein
MLRILLVVASWLALAAPAAAQCVSGGTPVWPTQITFQPAQPDVGQPVTAVLGPPISGGLAGSSVRSGANIALRGVTTGIDIGVPPPPSLRLIDLGGLPQGTYTVTAQLFDGSGAACLPTQAQLIVGGGGPVIESVPALGATAAAALIALLLALAWLRVRG